MMNHNLKIKMKNNKKDLTIFYNLVVMTKMTIFLASKIKKYRVKPFSQRQNKKLDGN